MCMKNPLFDMIIGNVPGFRKRNDPNLERAVVAATITKAQVRKRGNSKPLKVKEMTSEMAIDKKVAKKLLK